MVKITFYDGVRDIGGNKFLLEDGETSLFFDFGLPFSKRYNYFEEYLTPRAIKGLLDPLVMGLLPPIRNLYREDLVVDDEIWERVENPRYVEKVDGVLLTHAHLDHSGYISFLRVDVPVYSTQLTAIISKAMQDSARADFEKEVIYSNPRTRTDDILVSHRSSPYRLRRFCFLDKEPREGVVEFWSRSPVSTREIEPILPRKKEEVGGLSIRHFEVDHSIPGAASFCIQTQSGWVVYSGDLRLHGKSGALTQRFIDEARRLKPKVLILEGTNTGRGRSLREEDVFSNALEAIRGEKGLVVADFSPRNIERLLVFHRIAGEVGRELVLTPRDAYLLDAMRLVENLPPPDSFYVYKGAKVRMSVWEEGIFSSYRKVDAKDIHMDEGAFILCFSFFEINELIDISPSGGLYIYSASEAHNEEGWLDLRRLRNWLAHFGMTLRGDPEVEGEKNLFHASGHAEGEDLLRIAEEIRPEILIPIHTTSPSFFLKNIRDAHIKVYVPEESGTFTF